MDAANRHPQLLSYDGRETLGRNFKGTTDVLVADRAAIRARQPGLGMRLLFELKKKLADSDVIQAQASLLLANLHSPETRPMMVSLEHGLRHMHSVAPHNLAIAECAGIPSVQSYCFSGAWKRSLISCGCTLLISCFAFSPSAFFPAAFMRDREPPDMKDACT